MSITEGSITITIPAECTATRFDGEGHGLSHCMKAVDFLIETPNATILLELKDPDAAPDERRDAWIQRLSSGQIDNELKMKFRDTWLYLYGMDRIHKPIYFLVLIGLAGLSSDALASRSEHLQRQLPIQGPVGDWVNSLLEHCSVHNLDSWNRVFDRFQATRT
jgi:hypothetical protein